MLTVYDLISKGRQFNIQKISSFYVITLVVGAPIFAPITTVFSLTTPIELSVAILKIYS